MQHLIVVGNRILLYLTTILPCALGFLHAIMSAALMYPSDVVGIHVHIGLMILTAIPVFALALNLVNIHELSPETPGLRKKFAMSYVYTACTFIGLCLVHLTRHIAPGGDVDPIAFLEGKTKFRGGYNYLVDRTYRNPMITNASVMPILSNKQQLLSHVDSVATIQNYSNFSIDFPRQERHYTVTMTLKDACIHFPLNTEKVSRFFSEKYSENETFRVDLEYLAAHELANLAKPTFQKITIPPADCNFSIDIPEDATLGNLTEQYGITIARRPHTTPTLWFTIVSNNPHSTLPLFPRQN